MISQNQDYASTHEVLISQFDQQQDENGELGVLKEQIEVMKSEAGSKERQIIQLRDDIERMRNNERKLQEQIKQIQEGMVRNEQESKFD